MPLINAFRYRPEIDGLRALAVLSVVLFHAGFGFPGGFVGVDVFFVISGFLITSLIWKDLESGKFTLISFWEKRARRIAPALVVVSLATLVAGWFILLPADYRMLGRAAKSQVQFMANYFYLRNADYFASASDEMPLLHTWSLAVEEQFYLIMPLLMAGLFRFRMLRSRAILLVGIALAMLVSFGVSAHGVSHDPSATFYLLPGRAWELLLGSFVAFMPTVALHRKYRLSSELLSLVSVGCILYPMFDYTSNTPFPGLAALLPCLGTALFIWANGGEPDGQRTFSSRFFSWYPIVFLGAISYSLYLWHWPLLAFGKYLSIGQPILLHRLVLVGMGLILALFSWKFVELPFRDRKLAASTRSMYVYAVTGGALVFVLGMACKAWDGFPDRIAPEQRKFVDARFDSAFLNELTTEDIRNGKLVAIGSSKDHSHPTVLVWGDSHAMAALPAIDSYLRERGLSGEAATHSSTAPLLNWYKAVSRFGLGKDSIEFNDAVFAHIQERNIRDVILIARWKGYYDKKGNDAGDRVSRNDAILDTVKNLVAIGSQPWIMLEVPNHGFNIPNVLSRPAPSPVYVNTYCAKPSPTNELTFRDPAFLTRIEAAGGRIIDPKPAFLDASCQRYLVESDGVVLYRDSHHLTVKGANHVLLPLLREKLTLETTTAGLDSGKSRIK